MGTFTLVDILIKQKHYSEALSILAILEKKGKKKQLITQKKELIKKQMKKGLSD